MKSHDLARLLLTLPDLPVATHANNHTAADAPSRTNVALLEHYAGQFIIIGNFGKRMLNPPNWHISEAFACELPNEWREQKYPGLTVADVKRYAADLRKLKLYSDGIDRFNTGIIGTKSAQVDARGGPPEPQFGGRWCGRAWDNEKLLADTGRTFDTFDAALAELNRLLAPHELTVYR